MLAIIASILNIYVDPELGTKEYLKKWKSRTLKEENNGKVLTCCNLEHIIEAELFGQFLPA